MRKVKQNIKANHVQNVKHLLKFDDKNTKGSGGIATRVKRDFKSGGSAWESNPPKTLRMPPNGFEVREAHRDSSAPVSSLCMQSRL